MKQAGKKEGGWGEGIFARLRFPRRRRGWGGSVSAIPLLAEYQNRKIFFSLIEKSFGGARLKKCRENFSVLLAVRRAETLGGIQSAKSSGFCSKKVRISSKQYRTSASSVQAESEIIDNMWYTYLLLCEQKTFYVGISDNPAERLVEHKTGKSLYTKKFSDIVFIYCEKYPSKHKAALRERQIKGWSRAKKQMLIDRRLGYNVCTELVEVLGRMR
ncbi:MAG: GIY-YIG nuclease family protein [bacterium]|nr:GIY-YIG nuclease family protein [bacterium]